MFGRILLLFILISLSLTSFATDKRILDSLQNVLNITHDNKVKAHCLYTLSFEYGFIEPRKAIDFGKKCLSLSRQVGDSTNEYNAYNALGNAYETLSDYDSARYYHFKTFEMAKKISSKRGMSVALSNIALTYKEQGDYKKALKFHLDVYKLIENADDINPRMFFYIGETYMRLGDFKSAEYFTRTGIRKCTNKTYDYISQNLYINLAKCYLHKEKIDSATSLLSNTLNELNKYTDKLSISNCLNTLGEAYCKKKDFEKALTFFSQELLLQKQLNNGNGICLSYLNIANCYARLTKTRKARSFLLESEQRLLAIDKNKDILRNTYFKIAETYEVINEAEKALHYFKRFSNLSDSLLNKEKFQQINELQTKYDTKKREAEIKILHQNEQLNKFAFIEQKVQIQKRNYLLGGGSVLFILLGIAGYAFNSRQKLNSRLEKVKAIKDTEDSERLRIATDIHDELGSGLSKISFLSEVIYTKPSEVSTNLASISETSKNLVENMRDMIWALNPENSTLDNLIARIREYSTDYLSDFQIELNSIYPDNIEALQIKKETHRHVFLILKEALNNIVKHADASKIEIRINIDSYLNINIRDNGKGFEIEGNGNGNGLKNMKYRALAAGGKLTMDSKISEGTSLTITIPIKEMAFNS
jgi:signal transduction histidine kinase